MMEEMGLGHETLVEKETLVEFVELFCNDTVVLLVKFLFTSVEFVCNVIELERIVPRESSADVSLAFDEYKTKLLD
jgi:hypothetical protein